MFQYSRFVDLKDIGKVEGILLTFKTLKICAKFTLLSKESCSFLAKRLKYSAFVVLLTTQKFRNLSRSEAFQAYIIHNYNQNLHWKFGQQTKFFCFDIDNGLKNIFLGIKLFLFFKIESWNFQVQFEIKFRETLQNFNSIRQPI